MSAEAGPAKVEQTIHLHLPETIDAEEFRATVRAFIARTVSDEFGLRPSEHAADVVESGPSAGGRSRIDVLGELVDRLPDALSVAEVCLLLDRFDVALGGHGESPSIGAAGVLPPAVSDPILGAASDATVSPSSGASDAPSGSAS